MIRRILAVLLLVGIAFAAMQSIGAVDRGAVYEVAWKPEASVGQHSVQLVIDRAGDGRTSVKQLDIGGGGRAQQAVTYSQLLGPRVYAMVSDSSGVVAVVNCADPDDAFTASGAGQLHCEKLRGRPSSGKTEQ